VSGRAGRFTFPNPVNEIAARVVAGGVLVTAIALLLLSLSAGHQWLWGSAVLAYGFVARVAAGPALSPLGILATRVVAPRLGHAKPVPGPPKRFAQGIGAVVTLVTVGLVAIGEATGAQVLLGLMIVAAGLESIFAFCVGCALFAALMRVGLIPAAACEACSNIALRA
jgi:HAMP domain-containing protein